MNKLILRNYTDFEKIIAELRRKNKIKIDTKQLNFKLKTRIIDLIAGYIYERGNILKENSNQYVILTK